MRNDQVWLMASAIGLALFGPAFAADVPAAASTIALKSTGTHHLMGQVVSALAGLKPGDHVKVSYVADQGHLMAKTIAKNDHMTKK
jgi:tRNA (Thr-GGU) A37 N-methylase